MLPVLGSKQLQTYKSEPMKPLTPVKAEAQAWVLSVSAHDLPVWCQVRYVIYGAYK